MKQRGLPPGSRIDVVAIELNNGGKPERIEIIKSVTS